MPLPGLGASVGLLGGKRLTPFFQPPGTTAILRAGFKADITTFETNSVSASMVSGISFDASGPMPGWGCAAIGSSTNGFIQMSDIAAGAASSGDWLCLVAWFKTSDTGTHFHLFGPRVYLFGDADSAPYLAHGISASRWHLASGTDYMDGARPVADGTWHLCVFNQVGQGVWDFWVDGAKDMRASTADTSYGYMNFNRVGSGYPYGGVAPSHMSAVQIFRPALTDDQVKSIFAAAGFATNSSNWFGDRSSIIDVTSDFSWGQGPLTGTVNGVKSGLLGPYPAVNGTDVTGLAVLTFDLGSPKSVTGAYLYLDYRVPSSDAIVKWQGYDGASWVDISGTFLLDQSVQYLDMTPHFNSSVPPYTLVRIFGISDTLSWYCFEEIVFRITE